MIEESLVRVGTFVQLFSIYPADEAEVFFVVNFV